MIYPPVLLQVTFPKTVSATSRSKWCALRLFLGASSTFCAGRAVCGLVISLKHMGSTDGSFCTVRACIHARCCRSLCEALMPGRYPRCCDHNDRCDGDVEPMQQTATALHSITYMAAIQRLYWPWIPYQPQGAARPRY